MRSKRFKPLQNFAGIQTLRRNNTVDGSFFGGTACMNERPMLRYADRWPGERVDSPLRRAFSIGSRHRLSKGRQSKGSAVPFKGLGVRDRERRPRAVFADALRSESL